MAIRSNDANRASKKNQRDLADPNCPSHSVASEFVSQVGQPGGSRSSTTENNEFLTTSARRRRRLGHWVTSVLGAGAIGLMLAGSSGCTTTSGAMSAIGDGHCIDEFMIGYRNRAMAEKAWHCQKELFGHCKHPKEFKDGFNAGFMEVAGGGNGCVPSVAPKQYWGWRYQSAQGQGAVNSWFEGYPMGVRAAEQAGVGHWSEVRTAGHLNQQPQQPLATDIANPFYAAPGTPGQAVDGAILPAPTETLPLQAPLLDGPSGTLPLETGPAGGIEDVIDLDFDAASLQAEPNRSGFGGEPVFVAGDSVASGEARIAERNGSGFNDSQRGSFGNDDLNVEAVFGGQASSDNEDSLPFSFE